MKPTRTVLKDDISIENNTIFGVSDAPMSGTILAGEGTEPVVQTAVSNDVGVEGQVIISAAKVSRCGTVVCGK